MNSGYMKDLLKNWKERTEKAESELERVKAQCAEMREALLKRLPTLGAWENDCVLCGAHTECGDIPHKPDCPFVIAQNPSAGTGYVRKEDVVPVLEAAAILAERAPREPYPKEWNSDAVYRTHVPYCELIALARAVEHAKTKGFVA